jgi:asparagine synthase (glutamine-hydrolysing)
MSGICGMFELDREIGPNVLGPMMDALALTGGTEKQVRGKVSIGLGVVRRWEFQQIAVHDSVSIAADADLVDRARLLSECGISQAEGSKISIADVLIQLYKRCGLDFLKKLHGSFALALWDASLQRLVLSIDKIGVRGLYFRREGGRVLFGSRINCVRAVQRDLLEPDPRALMQYLLFSAVPAPLAIDKGTQKLRPGTALVCDAEGVREHQYWDLEYPESQDKNESRWANDLKEQIRSAVHGQLEGCDASSTGAFLSGGTDSSSVVAFLSEKYSAPNTFSIAFEEEGYSEIGFARTAAERFKTCHREKFLSPADAWNSLEKLLDYYDEPFANSSAFGSYYCAKLASENGVTTLLAGDGGDELFAGNSRYARDKYFQLYDSVPHWLRRGVIGPLCRLLPAGDGVLSLPRKYIRRAAIPNPRRILSYGFFLSMPPAEVFDAGFLEEVSKEDWLAIPERHYRTARATSELNRILYLDVKMTLADNDLRKVSGSAELAGVNVRYPLLDDRLAEFSGRVPASLKLKGFEKRYIFKKAMRGTLPDKILYKKKHGFGVPLSQWLLGDPRMRELLDDIMHDQKTRQRGYFRADFFDRLLALHRQQPNYYGEIVWYLVALELWQRRHIEARPEIAHVT